MTKCGFQDSYSSKCETPVANEGDNCSKHQVKCGCGKNATHRCTKSSDIMCGRPLCDSCSCKRHRI